MMRWFLVESCLHQTATFLKVCDVLRTEADLDAMLYNVQISHVTDMKEGFPMYSVRMYLPPTMTSSIVARL